MTARASYGSLSNTSEGADRRTIIEPGVPEWMGINNWLSTERQICKEATGPRSNSKTMAGKAGSDNQARNSLDGRYDWNRVRHGIDHATPLLCDLGFLELREDTHQGLIGLVERFLHRIGIEGANPFER